MHIAIVREGASLPVLSPEQLEEPIVHIECGDEVQRLDDGRVQCLTCMKTGYPALAEQ